MMPFSGDGELRLAVLPCVSSSIHSISFRDGMNNGMVEGHPESTRLLSPRRVFDITPLLCYVSSWLLGSNPHTHRSRERLELRVRCGPGLKHSMHVIVVAYHCSTAVLTQLTPPTGSKISLHRVCSDSVSPAKRLGK